MLTTRPQAEPKSRFVAVLHVGPVDSPLAAVRAAIVEGFKGA